MFSQLLRIFPSWRIETKKTAAATSKNLPHWGFDSLKRLPPHFYFQPLKMSSKAASKAAFRLFCIRLRISASRTDFFFFFLSLLRLLILPSLHWWYVQNHLPFGSVPQSSSLVAPGDFPPGIGRSSDTSTNPVRFPSAWITGWSYLASYLFLLLDYFEHSLLLHERRCCGFVAK